MEIKFESKLYERFLLFITNTSFFLMVLSVISDFLNSFGKNNPVNFLHYIFIFGISLTYFLIFENSFSSKSKGANQIRFFIFFILFIGFLCFIFRAIINGFIMIPLSSAMFFTYSTFFETFFYHDDFEEQCENKPGDKLQVELFNEKFIGEDCLKSIKSLKNFLFIVNIIFILFLCMLPFVSYKYSFFTFIFSFIFLASSFSNILLLTVFQKEIYYAFMGFEKQWSHRKYIIILSSIFVTAALLLGIIFSSGKALISLDGFKSLFKPKPIQIEKKEPLRNFGDFPKIDLSEDFPLMELPDIKPNKAAEIILLIVEIILAGLASFLVIYFLVKPFLSKDFFHHLKINNLKSSFINFIEKFKEFLRKVFNFRFKKVVYSTTDSSLFKKNINDFLKSTKKSKEKKAELDRLTSIFVKLIAWGSRNNIPYTKNLAPAEYTDRIVDYFRKSEQLNNVIFANKAGLIFEKALYSKDLLSKNEENDFKDSVNSIISGS